MKRLILTTLAFVMAICAEAAPALRGPFTIAQPDGTLLTVEQFGDEHHHWTATSDGTLVVNTGHGCYVARIDEEGELEPSALLAHEPALRKDAEAVAVRLQKARRALFDDNGLQARRRAMSISSGRYLPHLGNPRVLVILAAFQDLDFTVNQPKQAFEQYLSGQTQQDLGNQNKRNLYSVQQYFETCSHGLFVPQFDVVGPVKLPQTMAYYGGSNNSGTDDKFNTFCKDATEAAKGLVPDWSVYDNDNDGYAELVCVIYAGYGQNQGGDDNTIWAKASAQNIKVNDQLSVYRFNCSCELFHPQYPDYINGSGVFLHEFSHCMGLPDLYMTLSSGYVNNQGMESWSLMDYGLYNSNGYAPCAYTAWEQEVMGWTEIAPITDNRQMTGLKPLEEGGQAYKIVNPDDENDFIVLENIQQRGVNSAARGHGLLVYHVGYSKSTVSMSDSPNNKAGRPAVAVVPAGGTLINSYLRGTGKTYTTAEWLESIQSSTFPGTKEVTTLSDDMHLPNYCFYEGTSGTKAVNFLLNNITEESSGDIAFYIGDPTAITPLQLKQAASSGGPVFTLDGRRVASPRKGINIVQGRKVVGK